MDEPTDDRQRLRESVERQAKRIDKAQRERRSVIAQTVYLGTLGSISVIALIDYFLG